MPTLQGRAAALSTKRAFARVDGKEINKEGAANPLIARRAREMKLLDVSSDSDNDELGILGSVAAKVSKQTPFRKAQVTAAVIRFEWSKFRSNDFSTTFSANVATVTALAHAHSGVVISVCNDTITIVWGLWHPSKSSCFHACQFALELRPSFGLQSSTSRCSNCFDAVAAAVGPNKVSCAIGTGEAFYGAVGDSSHRYMSFLGPFAGPASVSPLEPTELQLLLVAAKHHNAIVVSHAIASSLGDRFLFRGIDALEWIESWPGRKSVTSKTGNVHRVLELVAPNNSRADGYEAVSTMCRLMNSGLSHIVEGRYDEGSAALKSVPSTFANDIRLTQLCQQLNKLQSAGNRSRYSRRFGWIDKSSTGM